MENEKLPRHLTVTSAALLNLGTNIGAGIFLVQGIMIRDLGSPGLVIVMFLFGGLISLFGTWSYVEMGVRRPVSGGPKEYLDVAFPKPKSVVPFIFSMVWIFAVMPGQAAAVCIGCGKYFMAAIYGSQENAAATGATFVANNYDYIIRFIGSVALIIITATHAFLPKVGVKVQDGLGIVKTLVLVLACVMGLIASLGLIKSAPSTNLFKNFFVGSVFDPAKIINNFFKVLFVYDGWATINYSLDELIEPERSLPKAAFGAFGACIVLYMGCTFSYFAVVPVSNLMSETAGEIGVQYFAKVLGPVFGGTVIPIMISSAAFSCVMCICFASSRLIFECARDGYFPPAVNTLLGRKSGFDTPCNSLIFFASLSLLYMNAPPPGDAYGLLVDMSGYPQWIFYGLSIFGLIVMNFRDPDPNPKFKSPLLGQIFFVLFCIAMAIMPFVPPSGPAGKLPYWLVPTFGTLLIILCSGWGYYHCTKTDVLANSFNSKQREIENLESMGDDKKLEK
ncbi:amino acid/polyamine transporter I [Globomyces pollinis-pini]|nr:amino acid/polyamine transporter I [Globomyces pollinis-pini]